MFKNNDIIWKIVYTLFLSTTIIVAPKFWLPIYYKIDILFFIIYLLISYKIGLSIIKKTSEKYPNHLLKSRIFNLVIYTLIAFTIFYFLGYLARRLLYTH